MFGEAMEQVPCMQVLYFVLFVVIFRPLSTVKIRCKFRQLLPEVRLASSHIVCVDRSPVSWGQDHRHDGPMPRSGFMFSTG